MNKLLNGTATSSFSSRSRPRPSPPNTAHSPRKQIVPRDSRNHVIRITLDCQDAAAAALGEQGIRDRCRKAGFPLDLVHTVHRRPNSSNEAFLMTRTAGDAQQIRQCDGLLKSAFPDMNLRILPENFYISPSALSQDDLKRMTPDKAAKRDYVKMFDRPGESLQAWRQETGLEIQKAYWKRGYLWLVLNSLEQAREAVSGKFYSLSGIHTRFRSMDPRSLPMICLKCYGIKHMALECPRDPRCGFCSLEHETRSCSAKEPKCVTCKGGHPSYDLQACKNPAVISMLDECKIWRGRALWDTSRPDGFTNSVVENDCNGNHGYHTSTNDNGDSPIGNYANNIVAESRGHSHVSRHSTTSSPIRRSVSPSLSTASSASRTVLEEAADTLSHSHSPRVSKFAFIESIRQISPKSPGPLPFNRDSFPTADPGLTPKAVIYPARRLHPDYPSGFTDTAPDAAFGSASAFAFSLPVPGGNTLPLSSQNKPKTRHSAWPRRPTRRGQINASLSEANTQRLEQELPYEPPQAPPLLRQGGKEASGTRKLGENKKAKGGGCTSEEHTICNNSRSSGRLAEARRGRSLCIAPETEFDPMNPGQKQHGRSSLSSTTEGDSSRATSPLRERPTPRIPQGTMAQPSSDRSSLIVNQASSSSSSYKILHLSTSDTDRASTVPPSGGSGALASRHTALCAPSAKAPDVSLPSTRSEASRNSTPTTRTVYEPPSIAEITATASEAPRQKVATVETASRSFFTAPKTDSRHPVELEISSDSEASSLSSTSSPKLTPTSILLPRPESVLTGDDGDQVSVSVRDPDESPPSRREERKGQQHLPKSDQGISENKLKRKTPSDEAEEAILNRRNPKQRNPHSKDEESIIVKMYPRQLKLPEIFSRQNTS